MGYHQMIQLDQRADTARRIINDYEIGPKRASQLKKAYETETLEIIKDCNQTIWTGETRKQYENIREKAIMVLVDLDEIILKEA